MSLQLAVELILAVAALSLLARDLRRAGLDRLRRPVTLLAAALVAALLVGTLGGRAYPSPWWLAVPGAVLVWELVRGWRRTPRSHLWEAGIGSFGVGLVLAGGGLGLAGTVLADVLLVGAAAAALVGAGLLWRSHLREPHPWRAGDAAHYERRAVDRPKNRA